MPTPLTPTEDWTQSSMVPQQGARRVFLAPGYATEDAAINAVRAEFGVAAGKQHPRDGTLYVRLGGIGVSRQAGPTTWEIGVDYAYMVQTWAIGSDLAPLRRPTIWEIFWGMETVETDVDVTGRAITNSAGTPFIPLAQRTVRTLHIRATRYYSDYGLSLSTRYMGFTNKGSVTIKTLGVVTEGSIKCNLITPTGPFTMNQNQPLEVVHEFEIRGPVVTADRLDPGFKVPFLDKGRSGWYKGDDGALHEGDFVIPDPTNTSLYIIKPTETLLDGNGKPIKSEFDAGVRIGTSGASSTQVKVATLPPPERRLDPKIPRIKLPSGGVRLLFDNEPKVDFSPLFAGL